MTSQGGEDVVKLTDFGLSKVFRDKNTSSFSALFRGNAQNMTTICGSDYFMAPELLAEQTLEYDSSIDVFALGLVHMVVLDYNEKYQVTTPLSSEYFLRISPYFVRVISYLQFIFSCRHLISLAVIIS